MLELITGIIDAGRPDADITRQGRDATRAGIDAISRHFRRREVLMGR